MQERTIETNGDEKIFRQFVSKPTEDELNARLREIHNKAIKDPRTRKIVQLKIGRNKPCPCGSGKKFKKCCIYKVNRGEELVKANR